ncbi:hypothetical protein HYY71_06255 [Candidatus Woesearchaeota archaeon]|nr:hypothetical protein [Candidatus Woesearchaeota archaeon]
MLIKLKEIEEYWKYLDDLIWGDKGNWQEDSIVNIYAKLSFLLDRANTDDEISAFTGVSLDYPQKKMNVGTDDDILITQIGLKERTLAYIEPDGEVIEEKLLVVGYNNWELITRLWNDQFRDWSIEVEGKRALFGGVVEEVIKLNNRFSEYIQECRERENKFHGEWLSPAKDKLDKLAGYRGELENIRPKNIRFYHTYKIIAPAIKNPYYDPTPKPNPSYDPRDIRCKPEIENYPLGPRVKNPQYDPKNIVCQETLTPDPDDIRSKPILYFKDYVKYNPKYIHFKRPDEVEAGLDENGFPLEVYQDDDGKWKVLLDKWWTEIASNEWQTLLITTKKTVSNPTGEFEYPAGSGIKYKGKGSDGGAEIWQAKVNNGVAHGIREVPEIFVRDLDILEAATYIYNEFDAYRDDFRDKRYHKHSKTTTDYILAIEGISTILTEKKVSELGGTGGITAEDYKRFSKLPFRVLETGAHIPKEEIPFSFQPMRNYITAHPSMFMNVPEDERRITREYQMKLNPPEGSFLPYGIEEGIRQPTHLNPGFDRRGLKAVTYKVEDNFIHWGRMYYYEDTRGINKWSENPFPAVSTRGLAKWIIYRYIKDLNWDDAKKEARNREPGYDYGIRRPLLGGDFITDPLGASDLVSAKSPLGEKPEGPL